MADEKRTRRRLRLAIPHPHLPHLTLTQVRLLRLFTLLLVFSSLVLYAAFRSTRFQDLLRRRSEAAIRRAIGREASIGGFDLSLVPPAFIVKDVRLANDPRGTKGPFFAAKEIALRGIPTLENDRVDLPKLRIVEPEITFEIFPDGTTNFPALPTSKARPGEKALEVRLGEALIQRGTFRFREWKARLDVLLKDALLTARSPKFSRATSLELLCRNGRLKLEDNDELRFALALDARLSPGRLHLSGFRLLSDRISVEASGGIDDVAKPVVALAVTARTRGEELRKLFGFELPLEGPVSVNGTVRVTPGAGFRVRGRFELPDSRFGPLPLKGSGFIRVDPSGMLAHLDKADYAGGSLRAVVRLSRLDAPPLPVKVLLSGTNLFLETFLSHLDLPGTGLMARADVESTLTFTGPVKRADGVGSLRLREAAGEASAVRGRFALPTSGGGPIFIRDGRMRFPRMPVRTAGGADMILDGTLTIDGWKPDVEVTVRTHDLSEVERIASNFHPAIKGTPLPVPLKLAGSGELSARFERDFGDPRVSGRLTATEFSLFGTRFGDTTAEFVVDRNVLTLSPFAAKDDGGALTVSGDLAWGGALGDHYGLRGLVAAFERWPVERVLSFLDFDLPLTGRVTGRLPLNGETPAVTGSIPLVWTDATVWGQKAERMEGTLSFEKDRLRLTAVDARIGTGRLSLSGSWRYADGAYEVDAQAYAMPLSKLVGVEGSALALGGRLTGTVAGGGTREKPRLNLRASVAAPTWDGKPVGGGEPASLTADSRGDSWSAHLEIPNVGRASARSADARGATDVTVSVDSLAFLRPFLPFDEAARLDGALRASARVTVPEDGPVLAEGTIETARLALYERTLDVKDPATFHLYGDRFVLSPVSFAESAADRAAGGLSATLGGSVGIAEPHALDVSVSGVVDASLLRVAAPGLVLAGPVAFDVKASGPAAEPVLSGRIDLDGVDLSAKGSTRPLESITGAIRLVPGRALTEGLSMRWSGGTVDLSGSLGLRGFSVDGLRLNATASRVKLRPFEGFASTLSGTVVITGRERPESARGELTIDRGLYDAPLDLGLGGLFQRFQSPSVVGSEPTPFDDVVLDVAIEAPTRSIEVRNNVARFFASGSLSARGTFGSPILLGEVDGEDGGRLTLRGLKYDLIKAELLFSDPVRIDPFFDLSARTRVRGSVDYDVTIGLSGTFSRVSTRLASDPPLSEAQIVSMIATGQPPSGGALGAPGGSTVSSDKSIREATRDLLTSLAADEAAERARKFFRLDRLQIDPVFAGNAFDAPRLTIGKSITPELSVTYSYKASSNEEQIIVVDYQLTPTAAVQFLRDEAGVFSVELKLRQRLR